MDTSPLSRRLPAAMAERARAYAAGAGPAAVPSPAATVVLLRDAPAGLEVFLVRRHRALSFAAGMHAFPGGRVDPQDAVPVPVGARSATRWAALLGVPPVAATAVVTAAARELAEECALVLSPDDLHPWGRWVTPRFEPRRYDTWFFLAPVPAGAEPVAGADEAETGFWVRPEQAMAAAALGPDDPAAMPMLPPTWVTLEELAGLAGVDDALAAAARRRVEALVPGWRVVRGDVLVTIPGDWYHPGDDPGERC